MLLTTLGGLALFLMGIYRISGALQEMLGPASRRWMAFATRSPFMAMLTGTGVAAATQSGTATSVTVLSLVGGGLVAIREGIALLLGAKLGATLAIQLAAFHLSDYALPMIGVGYVLSLWRRGHAVGDFILGAGMLFFGLELTVQSVSALSGSEIFNLLVAAAEQQPLAVLTLGVALGAVLSSSNAATAVALGLYVANTVSLETALALVVGGNAGASVMPLMVSRTFDANAQRAALMQMLVTAFGAVTVVVFLAPAASVLQALGGGAAREVANAHTLFNLAITLVGTLFVGLLAPLSARLVPEAEDDAAPKYLRPEAISDPDLGLALALRETVRISDQVGVMTERAVEFLRTGRWDPGRIAAREIKVDRLTHQVVDYVARIRRANGEDPISERLLLTATELEHMGDQIRRLGRREEKLRTEGVEFSKKGRAELTSTGERVLARMRSAFTALATGDAAMAKGVVAGRQELEELVGRMRVAHLARLEAQLPESRASSSHHLEVLTLLRDLDASVTRVAGWAAEIEARSRR
ncbi:MAG: Na/Pi cotransporter family protein [Trueperaceae bacterium]|nr:Na/Pi cotransporter family protein [Trueperaceae bacterium]HRQ10878.1 Na/Pi cotransporter family protein [Trueperaceae bacterium]